MVTFRRFAVFLCLISLSFAQQATPTAAPPVKLRKCPDTPIRGLDNKIIKVSQYRGKVVMIVMFLTSCQDCTLTLQLMQKMQNDYAARGLQVIGVSLDESSANLLPYQQRYHFPFPLGHLETDGASQLSGVAKTKGVKVPVIMFVDWMGNVRFQYQGDDKIFNEPEKNLRGIASALLRQAALKQGPQYETRPAPVQPGK